MSNKLHEGGKVRVFCPYIVKNGKRVYPKKARVFTFLVDRLKRD